jgi:hypothetical protein
MAVDGITVSNRLDNTTERKLHAKVVDNVLEAPTYMSRLMGMGRSFEGKTQDFTVDIENSSQFEWFTGLETLNSSAEDTTITLSYAHTAGTQPVVSIMLESFANAGAMGTIPLDAFNYEKAGQEAIRSVASACYDLATGDQPNGLMDIADDGTNNAVIGGQSRTTYPALNGTYTDSSGTLTLAKLGTLDDAVATGGTTDAIANINVTTFPIWSLYEQLLEPQARANYQASGYDRLPTRGKEAVKKMSFGGGSGFAALHHRGFPVIKDKKASSGAWFKLDESSFGWYGRTIVPDEFKGRLEKVNLGTMEAYESNSGDEAPSSFNGWFYQKSQLLPNQAGTIGRYYVIGQLMTWEPRKNGQLHSITGI